MRLKDCDCGRCLFFLPEADYLFLFPQEELLLVTTEACVDIGDICCIAEGPQVGTRRSLSQRYNEF